MQFGAADIGQAISFSNDRGESFKTAIPDGFESPAIVAPGSVSVQIARHAEFGPDSISDPPNAGDTCLPNCFAEWDHGDHIKRANSRMDSPMPGQVYAFHSDRGKARHGLRNLVQGCREGEYRAVMILVAMRVEEVDGSGIDGGLDPPHSARTPALRHVRHACDPLRHRRSRTILHLGRLGSARVH